MKQFTHTACIVCGTNMYKMFVHGSFRYLRCPECQHVATLPYPTRQEIEEHYHKGFQEENYGEVMQHQQVYQSAMKALADKIEKKIKFQGKSIQGISVLDIGCFTGEFLVEMRNKGARVYGVELQESAAKIAGKKLGDNIVSADILYSNLIFSEDQFDIVTLFGVIEHITDPRRLLERVNNFLKPGGLLMIQTPNSHSLLARIFGKLWPPYTSVEHIHLFSHSSIKRLLTNYNYQNIVFSPHVKKLTPSYVYGMLRTFGPRLRSIMTPFYQMLPKFIKNAYLPFYIGEMIVFAEKN